MEYEAVFSLQSDSDSSHCAYRLIVDSGRNGICYVDGFAELPLWEFQGSDHRTDLHMDELRRATRISS